MTLYVCVRPEFSPLPSLRVWTEWPQGSLVIWTSSGLWLWKCWGEQIWGCQRSAVYSMHVALNKSRRCTTTKLWLGAPCQCSRHENRTAEIDCFQRMSHKATRMAWTAFLSQWAQAQGCWKIFVFPRPHTSTVTLTWIPAVITSPTSKPSLWHQKHTSNCPSHQ